MNESIATIKPKKLKASAHESYWTYTLLALLVPIVGVIVGAVMMTKDSKLDKKLGEHTLALSILFMIIYGIAWMFYIAHQAASIPAYPGY